jgi:hypothetical protein
LRGGCQGLLGQSRTEGCCADPAAPSPQRAQTTPQCRARSRRRGPRTREVERAGEGKPRQPGVARQHHAHGNGGEENDHGAWNRGGMGWGGAAREGWWGWPGEQADPRRLRAGGRESGLLTKSFNARPLEVRGVPGGALLVCGARDCIHSRPPPHPPPSSGCPGPAPRARRLGAHPSAPASWRASG